MPTAQHCVAADDFHATYDEEIVQGNTSVHRWTLRATFTGQSPILPVPPNGKQMTAQGCHVVHWVDGKAVEAWHFGDWLGWLQQAGVIKGLQRTTLCADKIGAILKVRIGPAAFPIYQCAAAEAQAVKPTGDGGLTSRS